MPSIFPQVFPLWVEPPYKEMGPPHKVLIGLPGGGPFSVVSASTTLAHLPRPSMASAYSFRAQAFLAIVMAPTISEAAQGGGMGGFSTPVTCLWGK